MTSPDTKIRAIDALNEHPINVENLKDCDAYEHDYYINYYVGLDTLAETWTNDLYEGILKVAEEGKHKNG